MQPVPSSSTAIANHLGDVGSFVANSANLDARTIDQSRGNVYTAENGAKIKLHYGTRITVNHPAPVVKKLVWLPQCPPPCSNYISRTKVEKHIFKYFFKNPTRAQKRKCYVIHGLGGSGKSQITFCFVHRTCYKVEVGSQSEDDSFSDVYWIDATSIETIIKSLEDIACAEDAGSGFEDALSMLASRKDRPNWLMVFNNADETIPELRKYFPNCAYGNIIINSRNREARRYGLGEGSDYALSEMEHSEAHKLPIEQARLFDVVPAVTQDVAELVAELNYFPLSVSQAGAYIFSTRSTPKEYLEMFRTRRNELLEEHKAMPRTDDYQYASVQATLMISWEHLSPSTQKLLELYSFLHHAHISDKIFKEMCTGLSSYTRYYKPLLINDERLAIAAMEEIQKMLTTDGHWDVRKYRGVIEYMEQYSLVSYTPDPGFCIIHPLAQQCIRGNLTTSRQIAVRHATMILLGSSVTLNAQRTTEDLAFIRYLGSHVGAVAQDDDITFNGCRDRFGDIYRNTGKIGHELDLRQKYAKECAAILGPDHLSTLTSMNSLALVYDTQGNWDEAAKIHSHVLEIKKQKLGIDHRSTLASMHNLALVYRSQGKWNEAVELHLYVLGIEKQKLGPDHPDTLISMDNLALVYRNQGKWSEAAKLHSHVVATRQQRLGPDHPDTLVSMDNLALVYRSQGKWDEAAKLHSHVVETRQQRLGPDHPDTLASMDNLAEVYRIRGNGDEAAKLHSHVLETREQKLGADHPDTLASMNNLALVYDSQGKWDEAVKIHSHVLEIRKNRLGADHPYTLLSMNNLALVYHNQGKWDEAAKLHLLVVEARQQRLGPGHLDTLASMADLAEVYRSQGSLEDAVQLLAQILDTGTKRHGSEYPYMRKISRRQLEITAELAAANRAKPLQYVRYGVLLFLGYRFFRTILLKLRTAPRT